VLFGDPHVLPFDHPKVCSGNKHCRRKDRVNVMASGDFWVVRSTSVYIQGRYWSDRRNGQSSARALAVGGPFLQGNTFVIEQTEGGKVYWNEHEVLFDGQNEFQVHGLISARAHTNHSGVVHNRFGPQLRRRNIVQTVDIDLPLGVTARVNRLSYRIDLRISMRQLPGGQDGHCGNFNGEVSDDDTESINSRFGHQVLGEDLLFGKKDYEYVGCFGDLNEDRDLPVQMKGRHHRGKHIDIVGCSTLCSGYKFFARQHRGKCFCGNSYGKHGPAVGCNCDRANAGRSRNCVYKLVDAAQTPKAFDIEDCPQERRTLGAYECGKKIRQDEHSAVFFDACVFDFCIGGSEFVDSDVVASEVLR